MRTVALLAAFSVVAFSQELKPVPTVGSQPATTERALSESEVLKVQLATTELQLLQERYKIAEYQKEAQPIQEKQMAVLKAACLSVGVPETKMQTDCGISTGYGADGKPILGADGKQVPARVWNAAKPAEKK